MFRDEGKTLDGLNKIEYVKELIRFFWGLYFDFFSYVEYLFFVKVGRIVLVLWDYCED